MPWNPDTYNKFKEERYQPFYDLVQHIHPKPGMNIIDLGCGTGELTKILAERFENSSVLGIDNSAEMLAKAPKKENPGFLLRSVEEQLKRTDKWDLVVANASLQWVPDHQWLFPGIIGQLAENGQLAVQMPSQAENLLNQLLYKLVREEPYYEILKHSIRRSPVLSLDEYTSILYEKGAKETVICQKVYPIIARSHESLYEFISGSALVPYMEKMEEPVKTAFVNEFKSRIVAAFPSSPPVYPFKRILLVAQF